MITKVVLFHVVGKNEIVFFQGDPSDAQLAQALAACGPIEKMQEVVFTGVLEEIMTFVCEPDPSGAPTLCDVPSTLALEWATAFFVAGWNAVRDRVFLSGPQLHPEVMDAARLRDMSTRKAPQQLLGRLAGAITCSGINLDRETNLLSPDQCTMFLVASLGAGATCCMESPSYK